MTRRWLPETEDQLSEAVRAHDLQEDHCTDFKEKLKDGPSGNKELAKDLASFANEGGLLIVGVSDRPDDADDNRLRPILLEGMRERIDQVARSRITPALSVRVHELDSSAAGTGYLLVEIPASPEAPHQTDGRYWGRSDSTNYVLPDSEVRAIYEARRRSDEAVRELLAHEIDRNPVPEGRRTNGHLYIVAVPRYARTGQLLRALQSGQMTPDDALREFILRGSATAHWAPDWVPDFGRDCGRVSRRSNGWAVHSTEISPGRAVDTENDFYEDFLMDLEIDENGALHLFCGRAAADSSSGTPQILLRVVAGLAKRTLSIASELSEVMDYSGAWDLGLAADGLRGGIESERYRDSMRRMHAPVYSEPGYREIAMLSTWELQSDVDAGVNRLAGRLARAVGVRDTEQWIPRAPV